MLRFGLFPTPMEREARELIAEFDDPDPAARSVAIDRFYERIEGFVGVPELIRALGSSSPERRAIANACLERLTQADEGFDANASPADRRAAIARWRVWWERNQSRF